MWCPSVSLTLWANAWLAGKAAPDDVLDALSRWAPAHSVTAYDAVAATSTKLPWPDVNDAGAVSMLQTLRTAAGARSEPALSLVLPVPGDVRGLPAGTTLQRDALEAGEAVIVASERGTPVGLVPEFEFEESGEAFRFGKDEFENAEFGDAKFGDADFGDADFGDAEVSRLAWTVYSLPTQPVAHYIDLGEAEYELRSAVRSAADALTALRAGGAGVDIDDPRGMVEQILEADRHHIAPDHAPVRALRVLDNAAHVDAIMTVSAGLMPISTQSSSEVQIASDALRPLGQVARSARLAAVTAILHSAWER